MADDKLKNFIPISRKIFSHELWEEKREFSKFEAWVDLIQTARYEKEVRSEWVNNKEVMFGRGELIGSFRFLQKRWNWGSISKVERYLKVLQKRDMVVLKTGQGVNVITICKYDDYNKEIKDNETVKGQQPKRQQDKTNIDNNKELFNMSDSTDNGIVLSVNDKCENFVTYFNSVRSKATNKKSLYKAISSVKKLYNIRFKEGYTKEQFITAINNGFKDKNHIDNGFKYMTPEFILRDYILERYANQIEKKQIELYQAP
jgi:hypothetical protein